jgi:hypothetical protein
VTAQEHQNNLIGVEDCTVCGINRSICMDTQCPGDYQGDVPFIGQKRPKP